MTEGQLEFLWPTQHSKQMVKMPSYWTCWRRDSIRILEVKGEFKSIWIHNWAYLPRTLSMVRVSIFKSLLSWFPILRRIAVL